ncbi:hypothetical protein HL658_22380 [Azospirillum sp. RWY-5-1]|uniref:Uncharacterized protein n=1 Tax=Azospirillum oleiclasticum TaxID=2735135 RepID=A0ABX2TAK4_9PROT|nr:hypothetical protein [Azospirillum oleiclasticum]NYZ15296.1 hypothetical protein [Azospirillum oleiclasticum]NYZ21283.1 hypothetical protein [Azospirillum oleiclasticum]
MQNDRTAAALSVLVCSHCGHEVLLGEPMFWLPDRPGFLWHDDCAQAIGLLPRTLPPPKPTRRRAPSSRTTRR